MQNFQDDLIFVFIGTENYHFMIKRNITLLKRIYPNSPVLVYDWGDANGTPSPTQFPKNVEVINWSNRIKDTWHLMEVYGQKRRIEIGKSYNSRRNRGFAKRLDKFFLKRLPNSSKAKAVIERGLRYENLLLHKSYNLMECSKKLADKAFFLLDADAFLVDRIDEIFEEDPDIILPMVEPAKQGWDYNNCHGLSTGIAGFGSRTAERDTFLANWYNAIGKNDEWFRELAAMNRLFKEESPKIFDNWGLNTINLGEHDIKLKTIENDVYNCVLNYQDSPSNFDRVKILHLAGIAQRPHLFNHYFQLVEQELERRQ